MASSNSSGPEPATLPYFRDAAACREAFPEAPVLNSKFPELRHVFWTAGDKDDLRETFRRAETPAEARQVVEFIFNRYRIGFYVCLKEAPAGTEIWFVPFENVHFENPYARYLRLDPRVDIRALVADSARKGVRLEVETNPRKWRLANFLIRMETWENLRGPKNAQGETERSYSFYYYETYCLFRNLANWLRDHVKEARTGWGRRDLVVSYRDQLIVRDNSCDPMVHVVGNSTTPLPEQPYPSARLMEVCPVLSFGGRDGYSDRPTITPDDICQVLQVYVPPECQAKFQSTKALDRYPDPPWKDREPRAVFRGTATGAGMDVDTNQRLHLASQARQLYRWADVGVVGIPKRFKKVEWEKYVLRNPTFGDLAREGIRYAKRMTQEEQNGFRYQIYVEGNVAAYRLGKMLGTGSVILKVASKYTLWLDEFLRPWDHYVPVRADLSNLVERIEWLRKDEARARRIAENALEVYRRIMTPEFMGRWMATQLKLTV